MLVHDFSKCPRCGFPTQKSISFTGAESEFWYECTNPTCNTYINTYIPQAHQRAVHEDAHRMIGNFGAYGSGKTTTSREELYKHIFLTPGGNSIVGANVASQYEQTIKRDIEADLPKQFYAGYSTIKQYADFINGHRLMYRPFDDPNKLRSYNVSMFVMIEASEIKDEVFTQLKTRLRNMAATTPLLDDYGNEVYNYTKDGTAIPIIAADWRKGIIESNPDSGWIRTDILLKASDIQKHGDVDDMYTVLNEEMDGAISAHVTTCHCNEYLPKDFVQTLTKNKPHWWVARYIYGSFSYAEGLVYPSAMRYVIDDFEIPRHWKRIVAYDYGLVDPSVFLFGAVDQEKGVLYFYKEVSSTEKNIEELARMYHEAAKDIPVGGYITQPIIDPKSGPKRDYNKRTLADHFADFGIMFKPGHINREARIYRLNTYIESGKLRIMKGCKSLVDELRALKYKPKANSNDNLSDKPEDGNDHATCCAEWITMELPADPKNLLYGVYGKSGEELDEEVKVVSDKAYWQHILSDESEESDDGDGPFDMPDYFY